MAAVGRVIVGDFLALLANCVVAAFPLMVIGAIWNRDLGIELIVIGLAIGALGAIPTAFCFIACRAFKKARDYKYLVQTLFGILALGYWYWHMLKSDSEGAAVLEAFLIATLAGALSGTYFVHRRFKVRPKIDIR